MGMRITAETLSKTDMESKVIAKELGVIGTDKITQAFLASAP